MASKNPKNIFYVILKTEALVIDAGLRYLCLVVLREIHTDPYQ